MRRQKIKISERNTWCVYITNISCEPSGAIVSRWAPNNENNTAAYIRHVSDYTGIGPDKVLASPKECPTDWLLIGYAMAVVENGKALPAVPMLKGFSLAMS